MPNKALIVVDVQNDFLPGGALVITGGDEIIPVINEIQHYFKCIVAAQDWHPQNHISFAKTHHLQEGDVLYVNGRKQILWPVHCVQNTAGAEFAPLFDKTRVSQVFHKGSDPLIDSYSVFFDNEKKRATGLDEYLKQNKISEIYLTGLATEYCIAYSAKHAQELGYQVFVIIDACKGIDLHPGDVKEAVAQMKMAGIKIITFSQLKNMPGFVKN